MSLRSVNKKKEKGFTGLAFRLVRDGQERTGTVVRVKEANGPKTIGFNIFITFSFYASVVVFLVSL